MRIEIVKKPDDVHVHIGDTQEGTYVRKDGEVLKRIGTSNGLIICVTKDYTLRQFAPYALVQAAKNWDDMKWPLVNNLNDIPIGSIFRLYNDVDTARLGLAGKWLVSAGPNFFIKGAHLVYMLSLNAFELAPSLPSDSKVVPVKDAVLTITEQ